MLLVDSDPQASASLFVSVRDASRPSAAKRWSWLPFVPARVDVLPMPTPTVHRDLPARARGYDLVVVDTGGRDSIAVFRSALAASTDVLIPIRPAAFDVWAVEDLLEALADLAPRLDHTLNVYAVLVQVVARARVTDEALKEIRRLLREHQGRLLRTRIGSRVAWAQASGEGLAVTEFQPSSRAADELRSLVRELKL